MSIRVLVADDHPLFRQGLEGLFASHDRTELVGSAATGDEAVAVAAELAPDVVVMDVQMPELDGIEATRRIVDARPETAVLVLTMFEDDDSVFAAMRAGARGYLLKGAEQEQIVRAVQALADGEAIFDAALARRVVTYMAEAQRSRRPFPELTERESEVLDLVAAGRSNTEIGQALGVTPKTVRNNVSAVLNKLQVVDRAAAITRAREAGLGR
ncbi:MAG: response regulator [Thermoleophilaceae bacterium]